MNVSMLIDEYLKGKKENLYKIGIFNFGGKEFSTHRVFIRYVNKILDYVERKKFYYNVYLKEYVLDKIVCKYCNIEIGQENNIFINHCRNKINYCSKCIKENNHKRKVNVRRWSNRKVYTKEDVDMFFEKYLEERKEYGEFYNIFTKKAYKTSLGFMNTLNYYLDSDSVDYFMFLKKIHDENICCKICGKKYDYEDFKRGFYKKHCKECYETRYYSKDFQSYERGCRISKAKKEYAKTDKGKQFYKNLGKNNSLKLKLFFKTDKGKEQIKRVSVKQSITLKKKIEDGKFTPCITNTRTHFTAILKLDNGEYKKFRSTWEACFFYCNQHLLYEKIRIPYFIDDIKHIYITDFFDKENNIVYEIKPIVFFKKDTIKINQAINFCIENNLKFIWINEKNILNYIDINKFKKENYNLLLKFLSGVNKQKYEEFKNKIDKKNRKTKCV